ncbi:MAG: hypothetical protein H0X51_05045 [Parachlamydiaceae bacterium]|nr:hypothetical protein [Parachlamydiaceae bacterium]
MKDFHDLYTLVCAEKTLRKEASLNAVRAVFEHRKTPIKLPIQFDVSALNTLQNYWNRYRQTATFQDALPTHIEQIIETVNKWVSP